MLKQLSVPGKIFFTTTVLFILCYVGVFFHIHRAHAVPDWVSYVAKVSNIQLNSGTGKHTVYTEHRLQYDNDTSSTAQKKLRGRAIWQRQRLDDLPGTVRQTWQTLSGQDSTFNMKPNGIYWFATTRSYALELQENQKYRGKAYTNIHNEWQRGGDGPAEVKTAWFRPRDFEPFVIPSVPVEAEKP